MSQHWTVVTLRLLHYTIGCRCTACDSPDDLTIAAHESSYTPARPSNREYLGARRSLRGLLPHDAVRHTPPSCTHKRLGAALLRRSQLCRVAQSLSETVCSSGVGGARSRRSTFRKHILGTAEQCRTGTAGHRRLNLRSIRMPRVCARHAMQISVALQEWRCALATTVREGRR